MTFETDWVLVNSSMNSLKLVRYALAVVAILGVGLTASGNGSSSTFWALWALPFTAACAWKPFRRGLKESFGRWTRELLSGKPSRPSLFALIFLPAFFLFTIGGKVTPLTSYDNHGVNLTAASLLLHGTAELSRILDDREATGSFTFGKHPYSIVPTARGYFSSYPIGSLPFVLPVFAVGRLFGGDFRYERNQWRSAKLTAAALTAFTLVLFFLVAASLAPARAAFTLTAWLTVGSAFLSTLSHGLWSQGAVVFWLTFALYCETRKRSPGEAGPLFWQGVAFSFLFAARLSSAVLIAVLGLWIAWRTRREWWRYGWLVAGAAVAALPWGAFYQWAYGSPLGIQSVQAVGVAPFPIWGSVTGMLFSPGSGLFVYQPWLWLPLLGAVVAGGLRGGGVEWKRWAPGMVALVLVHLGLQSLWVAWTGGYCWGSRLLSEVLVPWALLLLPVVEWGLARPRGVRWAVAIALVSLVPHFNAVYLDGDRWINDPLPGYESTKPYEYRNYWQWSDPPFLYPYVRRWLGR